MEEEGGGRASTEEQSELQYPKITDDLPISQPQGQDITVQGQLLHAGLDH